MVTPWPSHRVTTTLTPLASSSTFHPPFLSTTIHSHFPQTSPTPSPPSPTPSPRLSPHNTTTVYITTRGITPLADLSHSPTSSHCHVPRTRPRHRYPHISGEHNIANPDQTEQSTCVPTASRPSHPSPPAHPPPKPKRRCSCSSRTSPGTVSQTQLVPARLAHPLIDSSLPHHHPAIHLRRHPPLPPRPPEQRSRDRPPHRLRRQTPLALRVPLILQRHAGEHAPHGPAHPRRRPEEDPVQFQGLQGRGAADRGRLRVLPGPLLRQASHAGVAQLFGLGGLQAGGEGQE